MEKAENQRHQRGQGIRKREKRGKQKLIDHRSCLIDKTKKMIVEPVICWRLLNLPWPPMTTEHLKWPWHWDSVSTRSTRVCRDRPRVYLLAAGAAFDQEMPKSARDYSTSIFSGIKKKPSSTTDWQSYIDEYLPAFIWWSQLHAFCYTAGVLVSTPERLLLLTSWTLP